MTILNNKHKNKRRHDLRTLKGEVLEDRLLLSISTGITSSELSEIKSLYTHFDYSEIRAEDVIVISPDAGAQEISRADLVDALALADGNEGGDLIVIRTTDQANTIYYTKTANEITVADEDGVILIGYGSKPLTIDAGASGNVSASSWSSRIFVNGLEYSTSLENFSALQLGNIDFTNAYTLESGGAIYNFNSSLILDGCWFYNNTAAQGGGVYSVFDGACNLEIYNSAFSGNSAGTGGAVYFSSGIVTIDNTIFENNTASNNGGALFTDNNSPVLTDLTFRENSAADGGAIYSYRGHLILNFCTFDRNTAFGNGGAIMKNADQLTVLDSTFSGNIAEQYYGGAIYGGGEETALINSTVTGNFATTYGGGVYNSALKLTILNSILLWNSANQYKDLYSTISVNVSLVKNVFYGSSASSYTNLTNIDTNLNKLIGYRSSYKLTDLKVFAEIDAKTGQAVLTEGTLALYSGGNADSAGTLIGYVQNDTTVLYYYYGLVKTKYYWINASDNTIKYAFDSTNADGSYGLTAAKSSDMDEVGVFTQAQNFINGSPASRTFKLDQNIFTAGAWSGYSETPSLIVTTIADVVNSGDGLTSLREAILNAKSGDTVTFSPSLLDEKGQTAVSRTLNLTRGAFEINKSLTIDAQGSGLVLWSEHDDALLVVYGESVSVKIAGLTFSNALVGTEFYESGWYYAAPIFNSADLTFINCTVSGNLTVTSISPDSNASLRYGSAICNTGTLQLIGCTIAGNETEISSSYAGTVQGGAVFNSGAITVVNSILTGNKDSFSGDMDLVSVGSAAMISSVYGKNRGALSVEVGNVQASESEVFVMNDTGFVTDEAEIPILSITGSAYNAGTLVALTNTEFYYVDSTDNYSVPVWVRLSDQKMINRFDASDSGDYGLNIAGANLFSVAQNISNGSSVSRLSDLETLSAGAWSSSGLAVDPQYIITVGDSLTLTVANPSETAYTYKLKIYSASDTTFRTSLLNLTSSGENAEQINVNTSNLSVGSYVIKIDVYDQSGSLTQTLKSNLTVQENVPKISVERVCYQDNQLIVLDIYMSSQENAIASSWSVSWGDAQTTVYSSNSFTLRVVHYYQAAGSYTIELTAFTNVGDWSWTLGTHYVTGNKIVDHISESSSVELPSMAVEADWGASQSEPLFDKDSGFGINTAFGASFDSDLLFDFDPAINAIWETSAKSDSAQILSFESFNETDWDLLLLTLEEEKPEDPDLSVKRRI